MPKILGIRGAPGEKNYLTPVKADEIRLNRAALGNFVHIFVFSIYQVQRKEKFGAAHEETPRWL